MAFVYYTKGKNSLTVTDGSRRKNMLSERAIYNAADMLIIMMMTINQFVIHNVMLFYTKLE